MDLTTKLPKPEFFSSVQMVFFDSPGIALREQYCRLQIFYHRFGRYKLWKSLIVSYFLVLLMDAQIDGGPKRKKRRLFNNIQRQQYTEVFKEM